jgi:hypothetical protein
MRLHGREADMTSWSFLFLSIAIHLALWFAILHTKKPVEKNQAIQVTLFDKSKENRPIVRQPEPPTDLLSREKKKPSVFSEKDMSVKKETQSQLSGLTHNGSNVKQQAASPQKAPHRKESQEKFSDNSGVSLPKSPKEVSLSDLTQTITPDPSTSSDHLDTVQDGPMTALNTEQFTYYNFFSRIEERVRPIWERNLQTTERRLQPTDIRHMVNRTLISRLEVLLDDKGLYVDSHLLVSSGFPEIDRDAIAAFAEARYYPNPPRELVKEDGRIHLFYDLRFFLGDGIWSHRSSL